MTLKTARIGVDIGGTFTDFVLHDETLGITKTGKRLSTPDEPSRAIIEGIVRLLNETGLQAQQIQNIVHGTTLITNTVLERTGARVGLLTNEGFRDTLEMGREIRYDTDDLFLEPVPVIVPRPLRRGIPGRLLADGTERQPLDMHVVEREVRYLVEEENIEALAISFLHSYRNRAHEEQARDLIRKIYPSLPLTISSEVASEIREYERANTACVNAYVQPRVHSYLEQLSIDLAELGFGGDLYIMLSSGGLTTVEEAKKYPVQLIESGPAAGAMAAAYLGALTREDRIISFDMGGTTAKMCVIEDGKPHIKHDFEAGRIRKFKAGSGLPLKVTVVDMIEIGTGGGSIAYIGEGGLMKVGPRSAGSVPGPVAYGRGGKEPTVTDADLFLGYLNPEFFLGGEMALSSTAVSRALTTKIGDRLHLDEVAIARGIVDIADEAMAAATRMHLAEKGKDPRAFTLFAFGGAGPVHAYSLAKRLNIKRVIVPMGAGVISAFGFLVAAPAVDDVRGYVAQLTTISWPHVVQLYEEMENRAKSLLAISGVEPENIAFKRNVDMRYKGQAFEIPVALPATPERMNSELLLKAFEDEYRTRFGRSIERVAIEVINWRLSASLPSQDIHLANKVSATSKERGSRLVNFPGFGALEAKVLDRYALAPGDRFSGPLVVEERESTCSIGPDSELEIDQYFNLVITINETFNENVRGRNDHAIA